VCPADDLIRVEKHLKSVGLKISPREVMPLWNAERLIAHCYHDKKAHAGGLTFILAEKLGKTFISHDVGREELTALLAEVL
jgi:3-dehydroquinate synthetase